MPKIEDRRSPIGILTPTIKKIGSFYGEQPNTLVPPLKLSEQGHNNFPVNDLLTLKDKKE